MRLRLGKKTLLAGAAPAILLLALAAVVFSVRYGRLRSQPAPSVEQGLEEFFRVYWQRPIALQGRAPQNFTEKEASLTPEACGSCHAQQYADWKESLHAKSMGSGPWGQILDFTRTNPGEAILCMTCHAPLSEQMPYIARTAEGSKIEYAQNRQYDPKLQLQGITCPACHVRHHRRFGPPKDKGVSYPPGTPNHGGVRRTPYFESAEFCRDCHQFDPENTILLNGKPLQDTYREWKNSIWGQGGAACQECHMPNRRHLWKGIHDPEMVRNGVRIEAQVNGAGGSPGKPLELSVALTNAAVGHKFPTYVTPKVFIRAALLDRARKVLPGTEQERVIGWDARFEGGEWKEYFDTRIPPGEKFEAKFRWALPKEARAVRVWVEVHPDHFYHVYFYPAYLQGSGLSPEGRRLVEKALEASGRTPYLLLEKAFPLERAS